MTVGAISISKPRRDRWRKLAWSLGPVATLLSVGCGAGSIPAAGQGVDYRSAATAPVEWQVFAKQLQSRFEQRVAAADNEARAFQEDVVKHRAESDAPPLTFVARAWVSPDGKIGRLEFDGLDDSQIAVRLRALLTRDNVGIPPPDMLQPLRLRLSLRPNEQKQQQGG